MTTSTEATSAEAPSLRDTLSQAYDEAVTQAAPADEAKTEELVGEKTDDDVTDEAKIEETTDETKAEEAEDKPEEKTEEDKPAVKAPQSWKPAVREKFAELPAEVQEEILRVESAAGRKFQESAQATKIAENFAQTLEPYRELIQSSGVSPFQAIKETMDMAKMLATGTQRQKAQVLAQLYSTYNVDLNELNEVLTAHINMPKPTAAEQQILSQLNDLRARVAMPPAPRPAEIPQDSVNTEIEAFASDPKNEFFNDVSSDMALLLQNGKAKTLAEAYDKAIRLNDEVQKVLTARKTKEVQRAAAGKASVRGAAPIGKTNAAPKNQSLREILSQAYDDSFGQ